MTPKRNKKPKTFSKHIQIQLLIFHVYFENVTPIYYSILQNISTLLMSQEMLKHPTSKVGACLKFCWKRGSLTSVHFPEGGAPEGE
jgi:hypothetical protein